MSSPRPIIIDCDPGVDDCFMLMVGLASPEDFDIRGICTVAGNVPVEVCTNNALALLEFAGRTDVPVYQGCERPLAVEPESARHVHGETGLGNASLPTPSISAQDEHAVDFLIRELRAAEDNSITLVPTGPLTNIAEALMKAPDIAAKINLIVVMGGADSEGGNITPFAEFNIYADPHAAKIVFDCGRPTIGISLDTTLQFRCNAERFEALQASGSKACQLAAEMIAHVNKIYGELYGSEGAAMHDPVTLLYLLRPDLFEGRQANVEILCEADEKRGHTAVAYSEGPEANVVWTTGIDANAAFDLLMERLERI